MVFSSSGCCDLLEKSYFCSIANNAIADNSAELAVVICLKNRTFAVSQTTFNSTACECVCCDLLEKSYFCSIANNRHRRACLPKCVVICLKNRTFAVSQTTRICYIAPEWGCDLLEKSYFCSIANNPSSKNHLLAAVVICLKNRTFAVSQTTVRENNINSIQL